MWDDEEDSCAEEAAAALQRTPEGSTPEEPVDLRKILVRFGYRVVDACARAEGFGSYADSDWSVSFKDEVNETLREIGARPLYTRPAAPVRPLEEPRAVRMDRPVRLPVAAGTPEARAIWDGVKAASSNCPEWAREGVERAARDDAQKIAGAAMADAVRWLVERGQADGQVPTVWWDAKGRRWVTDANDATAYRSQKEAQAVIDEYGYWNHPFGRATEHVFLAAGRPPEEDREAPLDLDAIRERCEAATDGPWRWHEYDSEAMPALVTPERGHNDDSFSSRGVVCEFGDCQEYYPREGTPPNAADRTFIAHARTDIPALLAEVERLRAASPSSKGQTTEDAR